MMLRILTLQLILLTLISCSQREESSKQDIVSSTGTITIQNAWARPGSDGMMGGGYLTIQNGTPEADTLIGVFTDAAESAEIHESYQQENGMAGMRPAGKLPIEPQSALELKPGGYHIMMMGLTRDLAEDDSIGVTLYFAHQDSLLVQMPVRLKR